VIDDEPKIFVDPLALPIIGAEGERYMQEHLTSLQTDSLRRTRAMIAIRARFNEEELAVAMAQGTAQYVVLGAGLDTFAYRRRDVAEKLTVFEVDYPATQAWKRERLVEAGIAEPANLRFVPVDFNQQTIGECLAAAGFRRDAPAFFSWLGVTYYLPRESVTDTFRFIGTQAARSQLIFDFAIRDPEVPNDSPEVWNRVNALMAKVGEPWQNWYAPPELVAELQRLGFAEVSYLSAVMAEQRYLAGRRDTPSLSHRVGTISARHA
jgi:methyltransferase (TIGR00027 family)